MGVRETGVCSGDRYGLYMVYRRFEGSRLRALLQFAERPGARIVSTGELSLLLEGSSFTVHTRAKVWQETAAENSHAAPI